MREFIVSKNAYCSINASIFNHFTIVVYDSNFVNCYNIVKDYYNDEEIYSIWKNGDTIVEDIENFEYSLVLLANAILNDYPDLNADELKNLRLGIANNIDDYDFAFRIFEELEIFI